MSRDRSDSHSSAHDDVRHTEINSATELPDSGDVGDVADGGWVTVAQVLYDADGPRDLTTVIISAIAEAEDAPITTIKNPPLYEIVDVAAVNAALFNRPKTDASASSRFFEFRYRQYSVRIEADGWVKVQDRAAELADDK